MVAQRVSHRALSPDVSWSHADEPKVQRAYRFALSFTSPSPPRSRWSQWAGRWSSFEHHAAPPRQIHVAPANATACVVVALVASLPVLHATPAEVELRRHRRAQWESRRPRPTAAAVGIWHMPCTCQLAAGRTPPFALLCTPPCYVVCSSVMVQFDDDGEDHASFLKESARLFFFFL